MKKKTFKVKWKAFFIIFKGLSIAKNCLRPESALLKKFLPRSRSRCSHVLHDNFTERFCTISGKLGFCFLGKLKTVIYPAVFFKQLTYNRTLSKIFFRGFSQNCQVIFLLSYFKIFPYDTINWKSNVSLQLYDFQCDRNIISNE